MGTPPSTAVAAAALVALEPAATLAYVAGPGGGWSGQPVVWAAELVLGIAALAIAATALRRTL